MEKSRIAEERKKLGLTQNELAVKLKISQKSISKYERGDRRPSYETLTEMSAIFGVTIDYLLGNERPQESPLEKTDIQDSDYLLNSNDELESSGASTEQEKKLLGTFRELDEDNQDILIGEAKKMLRDQRLEESVAADSQLKAAK